MRKIDFLFPIVATLLVFVVIISTNRISQKDAFTQAGIPAQGHAVYYWRTTFSLNDEECDFLTDNQIKKIYLRFFDVDVNRNPTFNDVCSPVASTNFYSNALDSVRRYSIEIVPVVFITPEAIKSYDTYMDNLAHRLYAMCLKNNIPIQEVQFDCDWTPSTRDFYFKFLTDIRLALSNYFERSLEISSTIRLHQLQQDPPDVDYGVLMCYNTGDFKDYGTENSILDVKDVKPYLRNGLKDYRLPLVLALPAYSWCVEFDQDKKFVRLNKTDCSVSDTSQYKHLSGNRYEVRISHPENKTKYVRYEEVSAATIMKTKKLIHEFRDDMPIVLFHLDNEQLSKYTDHEIKAFFD